MERMLWLGIALLTAAGILIAQWASLVFRGEALGLGVSLALAAGLFALHTLGLRTARFRLRAGGVTQWISRGWVLGSIAGLLAGLALLAVMLPWGVGVSLAGLFSGDGDVATSPLARAFLGLSGGLVLLLGIGAVSWGTTGGQRRVRVDRVSLPLRTTGGDGAARPLPQALRRLKLVQITDLHIGPLLSGGDLDRLVARVNELEPDLIFITGDIFDFDPAYIEEGCRGLAKLVARHGSFAVLGNHDVYTGADEVAEGLTRRTSIRVLRDEWLPLEFDGATLALAGLEDPGVGWRDRDCESDVIPRLAREIPPELPRLLLIHRPSYFAQAAREGFPLCLAGHTHGGQVSLPFIPHWNVGRVIAHWTRGTFERDDATLYVNRGLGVAGIPLRLNCPREIALLSLVDPR